jgi:hypothetical protein
MKLSDFQVPVFSALDELRRAHSEWREAVRSRQAIEDQLQAASAFESAAFGRFARQKERLFPSEPMVRWVWCATDSVGSAVGFRGLGSEVTE